MASRRAPASDPTYREIGRTPLSRERALAYSELSRSAEAAGQLDLAVLAKADEVHDTSFLQLNQHCLVAAGEMIELYNALRATGGASVADNRTVVWGLKYAVANALGVPEVPFATVDELIAMLGTVLEDGGYRPFAMWQAQADRYHASGDAARVAQLTEQLLPTISYANHLRHQTDCPSCSFYELARFKGPGASASEVEQILRPVLSGRETCAESPMMAEALYATALAREGRGAEAREHAERSLRLRHGASGEASIEPVVARVEAARAERDVPALREWLGALDARLGTLEDAYDLHAALITAYRAARRLSALDPGEGRARLERFARDALALARRLDARVPTPWQERATRDALAAADAED